MLPTTETPPLAPRDRVLWLAVRQALLIMLSAIETYIGMEHSRETRIERKAREAPMIDRH